MLKDAVLATIAYYDRLDYPLTGAEAHRYLINPQRLVRVPSAIPEISLLVVLETLNKLVTAGKLHQKLGFYMLADRKDLTEVRIEREKIAAQKWKLLLRRAYWLQMVPWVRGIFVSGSLALGNTTPESDFDLLVLIQPRRLYAARLLISGLTSLMRSRRTRYEHVAPDKFCFNHYVTTDHLTIEHPSLYNAQTYARLVPLMIDDRLAARFFAANLWINKYLYNFSPRLVVTRRSITSNILLKYLAILIEKIFNNPVGDTLERITRGYQQRRITANPATYESGGRVVFTDTELEFHPRSFERAVLERYNLLARRLVFSDLIEPDSGLR